MSRSRRRVQRAIDMRVRASYLHVKTDTDLAMRARLASRRDAQRARRRMGLDPLTGRGGQRDEAEHEARHHQLREHPEWTRAEHASARGITPAAWKSWRQRERRRGYTS